MAQSYPLGIQQLMSMTDVKVKQLPSGFKGNKYAVLTPKDDIVIMKAKENGNALGVLFGGNERSFHMSLHDTQDILNFSFRRPYTFRTDKMEVSMNGSVVCVVRQQPTFLKTVLHINDAADKTLLRIKGDFNTWNFELQTFSKEKIGFISKKYSGFFKEMFASHDTYFVNFPKDLDVCYKAAVIGSCVLIDYLHHER